jgi:hypothetical protein
MRNPILIEGFTPEEISEFPSAYIEQLVLTGEPLVFQAGAAQILGEFQVRNRRLVVELAQINDGESVLPMIDVLAKRYARNHHLEAIEWIIHAIDSANPHSKSNQLLKERGFTVQNVPEHGEAFYLLKKLS